MLNPHAESQNAKPLADTEAAHVEPRVTPTACRLSLEISPILKRAQGLGRCSPFTIPFRTRFLPASLEIT